MLTCIQGNSSVSACAGAIILVACTVMAIDMAGAGYCSFLGRLNVYNLLCTLSSMRPGISLLKGLL